MLVAGIDIGSLSTEAVILDGSRALAAAMLPTGANGRRAAERCYERALEAAGVAAGEVSFVVATGYGRVSFPAAHKCVTEITCHARGALHLFPGARTVIDVGGQDSKVIRVEPPGQVVDFVMNEKCAAGTGRFLEVMAAALEVGLEDLGKLSALSTSAVSISSMCTVFAESEVVSLIAEGHRREDIAKGLHDAIANRIANMVRRVGLRPDVAMTGGVAKNPGVVKALEERLGVRLNVPADPQMAGALGAALLARDLAARGGA